MKWRSDDCPRNGILEVKGNLFLRLKCCDPRCEEYKDRECNVEKMFNVTALSPADSDAATDSICCFNERLFDYGEFKNFEGVCSAFELNKQDNNGKTYYSAVVSNWLELLRKDRKLMFAVFAHISASIAYQHWQIFGGLNDYWVELIERDPAYYIDFRRMKQIVPQLNLDTQTWVELCEEHRVLYKQLVEDRECEFSPPQLASLLAKYPDLDDQAYEALKKSATGEVWMRLLRGGFDEEHRKFWDDCNYSSFNGTQWILLLENISIRDEALKRLNGGNYSSRFSDEEWKTLRNKPYYTDIKFRPDARNFASFFLFAPRHAARAQFTGMIGISLAVSVLGMVAMLLTMGAGLLSATVLTLFVAVWAVLATACISCVAVRKEWQGILHGVLVGAAGGAAMLLLSMFFWSRAGRSLGIIFDFLVVAAVFLVIFIVAAVLAWRSSGKTGVEKKADMSWVFYTVFALMIAGGALLFYIGKGADQSRYEYCRSNGLASGEKFFEGRFLEDEKYWARWEKACEDGDAEALNLLTGLWHPKSSRKHEVKGRRAAMEQLMNALLKEREDKNNDYDPANPTRRACVVNNFAKDKWGIDDEEKQYIGDKFAEEMKDASDIDPARVVAFLKVCNEYGIPVDDKLRRKVADYVDRRKNIQDMRDIWAQQDDDGKRELAQRISKRVSDDDFELVKFDDGKGGDIKCLTEIAAACPGSFDKRFWAKLLDRLMEKKARSYESACQFIEKLPECKELVSRSRNDYHNRYTRREIEKFERLVNKAVNGEKDDVEALQKFLEKCEFISREANDHHNDYLFWLGFAKEKMRGDAKEKMRDDPFLDWEICCDDWEICCDAFLNPRLFKLKRSREIAKANRCRLAWKLADRDKGRALQLWKMCLEDDDFWKKDKEHRKRLKRLLRDLAPELAKSGVTPANVASLLRLYDGKGLDIPDEVGEWIKKNIVPGKLDPKDKLEIAKYYMSIERWDTARDILNTVKLDRVKECVKDYCGRFGKDPGEVYYRLAQIDQEVVDEIKRRLDQPDPELAKCKKRFEKAYEYKNRGYVREANGCKYPDAIFIICVDKYYSSLSGDEFNIAQNERDLKKHHPDSEYVEYLEKLKKAADARL